MNSRLVIILALILLLVISAAAAAYMLIDPRVDNALATRTAVAEVTHAIAVQATETVSARTTQTRVALALTETARPTHTPTATNTATATTTSSPTPTLTVEPSATAEPTATAVPTITPTPLPQVNACAATITGSERYVYALPGGGDVASAVLLPQGTAVNVIGRIADDGWLQIGYEDVRSGWVRRDFVQYSDANCQPTTFSLAFLLNMDASQGREALIDETFASNTYTWSVARNPGQTEVTTYGEAYLPARVSSTGLIQTDHGPLQQQSGPFTAVLAFQRRALVGDSYVGLRFRASDQHAFKVTVDPECVVRFYQDETEVLTRDLNPTGNDCRDEIADQLVVTMNDNYDVRVELNGPGAVAEAHFNDPDGLLAEGAIELEVHNVQAELFYLVVAEP